ncbi:hypothetical protein BGZ74_010174 [Mortierella antarctica]|nr:hypothetical protein BGZ74_010174 [Mortierella antarctica]
MRPFEDFLQLIRDASEAGNIEKTTALELLNTITLPDFQVESHLMKKQAATRVAGHAKEKVRENSFASAAALITHAEDELVKDITKRQPPITDPQEKEFVRKRVRTEVPEASSFFEPWGSLMKVMHDTVLYGQSDTPIPASVNLSVTCKALYKYICAHLEDGKAVLQHEKDLLVAMSGVINLRAADTKDMFGMRLINEIEASAPKAQPDDSINNTLQSLSDILNKSSIHYLRDEISILDAERVGKSG